MAKMDLPPQDLLLQILRYDPDTGKLYWMPRAPETFPSGCSVTAAKFNTRYGGKEAFTLTVISGHRGGRINYVRYMAHRVIWKMVTGRDPIGDIDHINGNPSDNRIGNLRDVPHAENQKNVKLAFDNTSGRIGVWWNPRRKRWIAQIGVQGRKVCLGQFVSLDDASSARIAAERRYGFHENHGRGARAA